MKFIAVADRLGIVTVETPVGVDVPIRVKLDRLLGLLLETPVAVDIGLEVVTVTLAVDPGMLLRLTVDVWPVPSLRRPARRVFPELT